MAVTQPHGLRQHREAMRMMYENGKTLNEVAAKFGCGPDTVSKHLRNMGVQMRPSQTNRKHDVDHSFFDRIDTPEKAWVLGFFLSDGHCRKRALNTYRIEWEIQARDRDALVKIKEAMRYTGPIKESRGGTAVRIGIASAGLGKALSKLVCVDDKSHSAEFPACVPKRLMPHFLRGLIDGDGTIHFSPEKPRLAVSLVGTKSVVGGTFAALEGETGVPAPKISPLKNIWYGTVDSIRSAPIIINYLYSSGGPSLDRKRATANAALAYLESYAPPPRMRNLSGRFSR